MISRISFWVDLKFRSNVSIHCNFGVPYFGQNGYSSSKMAILGNNSTILYYDDFSFAIHFDFVGLMLIHPRFQMWNFYMKWLVISSVYIYMKRLVIIQYIYISLRTPFSSIPINWLALDLHFLHHSLGFSSTKLQYSIVCR